MGRYGGNLEVVADTVLLSGADARFIAVQSSSSGTGNAGNVRVTANGLQIVDGRRIGAQTRGSGQGGNIDVRAERVFMSSAGNPTLFTGMAVNTLR